MACIQRERKSQTENKLLVNHLKHDENKTDNTNDVDTDAMAISYSITDDLSVTYGSEEHDKGGQTVGAELEGVVLEG